MAGRAEEQAEDAPQASMAPGTSRGLARRSAQTLGVGLAVVVTALGALGLWARASNQAPQIAAVGSPAPEFDLPVLGRPSEHISLRSLHGKPVIIVFNCGCKACDEFDRALAAAAPRLRGTETVAITMNPSAYEGGRLAAFRKSTGFRWPLLVDERMETALRYDSGDCPQAFAVDRRGVLRRRSPSPVVGAQSAVAQLAAAAGGA